MRNSCGSGQTTSIFFVHTHDLTATEQMQLDARGVQSSRRRSGLVVENDG